MALAATTTFEVESGGSDTLNGGAFDPGQTAGMFTDGAATVANTASPVFTSASYNFLAGDANAWLFIGAGTNWTKGWYKIASVAANAATLSAAIGAAVQSSGATTSPILPSTTIGCASTASPTGATWSIDYSQQTAAQFAYTDLASAGAGLTMSSAAHPLAKQQVGNAWVITGGTNFTAGRYVLASVAAGVGTFVGPTNVTTGVGAAGTGGMGGAFASPGIVGSVMVGSNQCFVKTATYTVTSATTGIAAGCFSSAQGIVDLEGYATVRGDLLPITASGTLPTIIANGSITAFTLVAMTGGGGNFRNFIIDGNSRTSSIGVNNSLGTVYNVRAAHFSQLGFQGTHVAVWCSATACSAIPFQNAVCFGCTAYANTVTGFTNNYCILCLSYGNTGASSDGFSQGANVTTCHFCTAYGNGRDGFRASTNANAFHNCISEGNTGLAFNNSSNGVPIFGCAAYNNTGGTFATTGVRPITIGFVTGTASFFTNAAGGDFSLNNTAGGGAALRAAGFPATYLPGLTANYWDIGASQHLEAAGGGAVAIFGG